MSDDFPSSIKGILKAYDTGIKLAKRLSRSATDVEAAQALQISESTQRLQRSFQQSTEAITKVYTATAGRYGDAFVTVLTEDKAVLEQLKELRIELIDQINECQGLDDDPHSFDTAALLATQKHSERICGDYITILEGARVQLSSLQRLVVSTEDERTTDDRKSLTSMRSPSARKPVPTSPQTPASASYVSSWTSPYASGSGSTALQDTWAFSPLQSDVGDQGFQATPPEIYKAQSVPPSSGQPLIPKAIVVSRLNENDDFLERRRQSRIAFQKEFRKSVVSIEENRASTIFADSSVVISPILESSPILGGSTIVSPVDGRNSRSSLSGYDVLMTRQRSQGHASSATRSSRTSSLLQDPIPEPRTHRQNSEDSIFGLRQAAPSSPPLSDGRSSGADSWGPLATTLKLPGYGSGVEEGLETVNRVDLDNEKIPVISNDQPYIPTTSASVKSVDYPMRHDTSFYKFGGFCDGARAVIRGDEGFKIMKRPSGHYSATVSARCIKCSYEVGWNEAEKDKRLDKSGIYGSSGIRWRQRFINKCHLRTNAVDEPLYACIFCIEEHKVIEEHDATVFFSVAQLFNHLAKHPRPLRYVSGIHAIYGRQEPNVVDFDIHFVSLEPRCSPYGLKEISHQVATRPSGFAVTTYHPKNSRSNSKDPEGNPTLHFANGARILGIEFPDRFSGAWCTGYHDGERGSFPSAAVMLELPAKEDVYMNVQSTLIAYAKWDHKPKDSKDGGWLKFSRGDRISSIGYTFQDQWCWSGQTTKGKWGLFPMAFVENLQDGGSDFGSSPGSLRSGGLLSKFGSRSGGLPIGRKKAERSASLKSSGSVSVPSVKTQPGLEVVVNGVVM